MMKDSIIEKLIKNDFISEDWGYFSLTAFRMFYKNIAPMLQKSEAATFPKNGKDIFKAFKLCPLDALKVVIVGQDPYHDGSATGLAFDNVSGKKISPSLRNILAEMINDDESCSAYANKNSYLEHLPKQGVLLVNAALTVELGSPNSQYQLWEEFTKEMFTNMNKKDDIVWVLWGNFAQRFEPLITNPTHKVIKGVHPSPLSANRGFFGSKPFSAVNKHLEDMKKTSIKW